MIHHLPVGRASDVAATTVIARWQGQIRVTAVCKATFRFAPRGEMTLGAPVDIARGDLHHQKNPMRSVRVSSDVSPHLERVDVLFVGRAHAPRGQPVERMTVRLAVADDVATVLDKRLTIVGDRKASDAAPEPFLEMPIVYERALGGLGFADNPLGVGIGAAAAISPNVLHPDPTLAGKVAGFGPRSAFWPVRKKLLRGRPRPTTDGLVELPDDVDWIYFQAAPPDQWLDELPHRAWIVLEGLNPRSEHLPMRLPPLRTVARLHGSEVSAPIELRADTLLIDGEAEHCTVTWRGSFPVESEEAIHGAWVAVALEAPGRPLAWPMGPVEEAAVSSTVGPLSGTVAIDDRPSAPPSSSAPRHAPTGTMIVDGPAGGSPPGAAPALRFAGTQVVEDPPPFVAPLPFVGARIPMRASEPPAPLPGAPWAGAAAPAPTPAGPRAAFTGTMIDEPPETIARPPPPAPPPPSAPPPPAPVPAPPHPTAPSASSPGPARREDPWPVRPPEAPPAAAPAPRPALPPKQDIGSALYRRKKP